MKVTEETEKLSLKMQKHIKNMSLNDGCRGNIKLPGNELPYIKLLPDNSKEKLQSSVAFAWILKKVTNV